MTYISYVVFDRVLAHFEQAAQFHISTYKSLNDRKHF